ncbi:GNAT family acetyltransferase [Waterburya agarophytonicola K14]|uniref:GNAT family acetyltransferase n=1 Tax=Waterburya agarophytonicola KI4 TaxID=2874699 RepID=A0A964BR14_9CYAN|nr:hypothetical protein [Waterburya agarophytonicola]MCC0177639.1 GNAT family acetyltransferase [Waterburya agarophytonicola KI4]
MITRLATESDVDGILQLQSINLLTNLSVAELAEGFVTTPITDAQVKTAIAKKGVFVVENNNKIAGYVFAADWDYFSQWAIFPYMVSRFPQLQFEGTEITVHNTFEYGPICIEKSLRGSNALPDLFEIMRSHLVDLFPVGITFINRLNQRSLAAHTRKLNLQIIDEFEFNNSSYYTLAFLTKI